VDSACDRKSLRKSFPRIVASLDCEVLLFVIQSKGEITPSNVDCSSKNTTKVLQVRKNRLNSAMERVRKIRPSTSNGTKEKDIRMAPNSIDSRMYRLQTELSLMTRPWPKLTRAMYWSWVSNWS
jgi:hypothetical protein